MKRVTCFGVVAVVLVFVTVGATHSQTYNSSRGSGSGSYRAGGGSGGSGGTATGVDPEQMRADFQRRMAEHQREFQQKTEQMQRQAEESRNQNIRDALRATDEQWQQLKPKLDRIERLKAEANVALDPGSFGSGSGGQGGGMSFGGTFGGGWASGSMSGMGPGGTQHKSWSWGSPSGSKSPMDMTAGEVLCEEFQRLLYSPSASSAEIAQKVEALRKTRTKAREDLAAARKELRASISQQQEAPLVVMGYLD